MSHWSTRYALRKVAVLLRLGQSAGRDFLVRVKRNKPMQWPSVFLGIAILFHSAWAAAESKPLPFNIPSQQADAALLLFGKQADISVVYQHRLVKTYQTNQLKGEFTPQEGIRILLRGSGLKAEFKSRAHLVITQNNQGNEMNSKKKILAATVGFFMGAGANGVMAQETTGGEELDWLLEEVVVTAQKREQRLVDVPISVSVMGEDELKKRSIQDLRDLSFHVPNFTIEGRGDGVQRPVIRGVNNPTGSSSLAGIYFDEVALPTIYGLGFDLQTDDMQHVEVLKGPQGTLFGQGAMGGVVRFISNKPTFEDFEGVLRTSGSATKDGDFSQEYSAVVNMPIVDDVFSLRLNATYKDLGGWIDTINSATEEMITENSNDKQVSNLQIKGLWRPSEDLSVDILAIQYKSDAGNVSQASRDSKFPLVVRNDLPFYSTDSSYDYDIYGLTLTYDLGFATLTSASSSFDTVQDKSSTGGVVTFATGATSTSVSTGNGVEIEGINQEIRLTGTNRDVGLNWTAGVFFNKYELGINTDVFTRYQNGDALFQLINNQELEDSESMAYFIDTSYAITEQLTLDFGVRYFEDDKEVNSGFNLGAGNSVDPTTLQKATFDKVSSKMALAYALNDNSNIYLRVAEGFRSGGFNSGDNLLYDPESLIAYELGFKTVSGRLNVEGNLYYSIYDDYQGFVFDDSLPNLAGTINAGEAEIKGFEWLLQWQVDDQWSFAFNGHLTESELTSLHPGFFGAQVGDPLDSIAKYSYGVSVDYVFNWSSSISGFAHMAYNRQGPSSTTNRGIFARGDSVESNATGYLNIRTGAEWDAFSLSFFGRNLTNENRPNILVLLSEFNDTQNRPREFGVDLSYRF